MQQRAVGADDLDRRALGRRSPHTADRRHREARGKGQVGEAPGGIGRNGRQHLVVVPAAERRRRGGLAPARRLYRRPQIAAYLASLDGGAEPGGAGEAAEILDKPVRHVHRGRGVRAERRGKGQARLGTAIAAPQPVRLAARKAPGRRQARVAPQGEPEAGVADRAGDEQRYRPRGPCRAAPCRRPAPRRWP